MCSAPSALGNESQFGPKAREPLGIASDIAIDAVAHPGGQRVARACAQDQSDGGVLSEIQRALPFRIGKGAEDRAALLPHIVRKAQGCDYSRNVARDTRVFEPAEGRRQRGGGGVVQGGHALAARRRKRLRHRFGGMRSQALEGVERDGWGETRTSATNVRILRTAEPVPVATIINR